MTPGKIFDQQFWFVIDYQDKVCWVYHIDGSQMFVCALD